MGMKQFLEWSKWYSFSDVYEFYGIVERKGAWKAKHVEWNHDRGPAHTDNGFRLRSYAGGSFKNYLLMESLDKNPCPLTRGDIGVYWIKITFRRETWDYIGKCAELKWGIPKRLMDHFSKISGFGEIRDQFSTTENFQELRNYFKGKGVDPSDPGNHFFEKHVQMAFVFVTGKEKNNVERISKIEGMALQAFKFRNGSFPRLNSTNETAGMGGFDILLSGS